MMPLELLLSKLPGARKSGSGWAARCPAHEDRRASLSVRQADDGTILVKCHAGCNTSAVLSAVGLQLRDLFPKNSHAKPAPAGNGSNGQPARTYATANDAVAELERKLGPKSAFWTYTDAAGQPVGVVVRWDLPDGKTIRPVSRSGDGWRVGAMPAPRPLYRLPELTAADHIVVVEGEKCADAACKLGFAATTSAGGASAPGLTDWGPLKGKDVTILPDNDEPGERYAREVAGLVHKAGARSVRIVRLKDLAPDLPLGGDLADILADARLCGIPMGESAAAGELLMFLLHKIRETAEWRPEESAEPAGPEPAEVLDYKPFPVAVLPEPIRGFVDAGARAIVCDPAFVALPLLTALGAAIGNTRRVRLKRGWSAPPLLWTAIVGESGTSKSPALDLALQFTRDRQDKAFCEHDERQREFKAAMDRWSAAPKAERGPAPEQPKPCERFAVSDTTVEALATRLAENPRGLLLARDELAGWLASFDRYVNRARTSSDAANWLSMHHAGPVTIDRKTGEQRTLHVPRAFIAVTGGVQPGILARALNQEHRDSGFAARLLFAFPPRRVKVWSEAEVEEQLVAAVAKVFDKLYSLQPDTELGGKPRPGLVRLDPEARASFLDYYGRHAAEHAELEGDLSAAWSKLEEAAARLALILHLVRWANGEVKDERTLDATSMQAGIALAEWFKHEARRVYAELDASEPDRDRKRLLGWIERQGGQVTARQLQRSNNRRYQAVEHAEAALAELVRAGLGEWRDQPSGSRGGQPTRVFCLRRVHDTTS